MDFIDCLCFPNVRSFGEVIGLNMLTNEWLCFGREFFLCLIKKRKLINTGYLYIINFLSCDSAEIRTRDPQLRRLLLYPAELPNHPCVNVKVSVIPLRFERRTHALEGRCSIQLSYGTILNCAAKVVSLFEICKFPVAFCSSWNAGSFSSLRNNAGDTGEKY